MAIHKKGPCLQLAKISFSRCDKFYKPNARDSKNCNFWVQPLYPAVRNYFCYFQSK